MLTQLRTRLSLSLGVLLLGQSLFAETWCVSPKPSPEKRLAPELYLVRESGAEWVGMSRGGRRVFCGKSGHKDRLRSMAAGVSEQAPTVHRKGTRLLLRYRPDGARPSDETLAKAGLKKLEDYERGSFLIVEPQAVVSAQTVDALLADEAVLHATPDYLMSIPAVDSLEEVAAQAAGTTTSDPYFPQLWGMKNSGATLAWDVIKDAPKVVVAVIDTGVDYTHPDLKANMWSRNGQHGYDFFDDDGDPMDEQDHGTHCAGTIAGVGNNGVGVVGVAWQTQIMAMRFLGPDGSGATSDAVKCIDWAVANGAHVLSNSWAGPALSQELVDAVRRAEQKGVLFVAAAGNTANTGNNNDAAPYYPASLPNANIISVGAIDVNNARGTFSHYGKGSVDIGAPGVGILSTVRNNQYATFDGTSMATPHVAGAAVLVWAKTFSSPAQDPRQMATVRDLIYANARPIPALKNFWGYTTPAKVPGGVLDISFLGNTPTAEQPTPAPTPTPTPAPSGPSQPADGSVVVASTQFASGEIIATKHQTVASAKLTLTKPSVVQIVANTSIRSEGRATQFATGFADKPADDQYWSESIRNPELRSGGWINIGSNYALELPAGEHTIRWKVWMEPGARVRFSAGSMLIQADALTTSPATTPTPFTPGPAETAERVRRFNSRQ